MEHPLDGAYARLARAEEHVSELERIIRLFLDDELRNVVGTIHFDADPPSFRFNTLPIDAPERVGLLIGDVIQNTRAALDYLVFELAKHHEGVEKDRTQFPIESSEDGWNSGRVRGYLQFVCPVHIARVKELQPCYGCNWTGLIATLSNRDKHRTIVASLRQMEARLIALDQQAEYGPIQLLSDRVVIRFPRSGTMDVQTHITLVVTVEGVEGKIEVVELLRGRLANVRDTLDQFRPEFERQPAPDCKFGYPGHAAPQ